jgi:hypothetical protein
LNVIFASVLPASVAFSSAVAHASFLAGAAEVSQSVLEGQAGTSGGMLPPALVGTALCMAQCGGGDDLGPRQMQG